MSFSPFREDYAHLGTRPGSGVRMLSGDSAVAEIGFEPTTSGL